MRVSLQVIAGAIEAERENGEVGIMWNTKAGRRR